MIKNSNTIRKIVTIFICIILVTIPVISINAASYSKGNYVVSHKKGVNVRDKANVDGNLLGAAQKGTSFSVIKVSGEWGYTEAIKTTKRGIKSGWVNLKYCEKKSANKLESGKSKYNADKAISYAKKNWNNGKGLCAEFVSNCVIAGGLKISKQVGCKSLYDELKKQDNVSAIKLVIEKDGKILHSKNPEISKGDVIIQYCTLESDGKPWAHATLVSSSKGYVKVYAHNKAKNNEVFNFIHCPNKKGAGASTSTCYLIHFE